MPHATARRGAAEHRVAFFHNADFVADRVTSFVAEGLAGGEQVIMLASRARWDAVCARLDAQGIALTRALAAGRLLPLDADDVLDTVTVESKISVNRFRAALQRLVDPSTKQRVYGELVSLLAARGDVTGAVAIERSGHELAHGLHIPVLCGYHTTGASPLSPEAIEQIEAVHDGSVFEGRDSHGDHDHPHAAATARQTHAVRFYENRESLARIVGRFLGEGFVVGLPAIVIATPEHRDAIRQVLTGHYFDLDRLSAADDLIMVDAAAVLSQIMRDGMPDPIRFNDTMTPLIEKACRGRRDCVIRAYGEMVDVLWKAGETAAAIRLEMLWNQLAQTHSFALLCGYSMGHFYKDAGQTDIRRQHTHVVSDSGEHITLH
jgi:hypothetical protein